jgi:amino acid adenylation domain-containing protein
MRSANQNSVKEELMSLLLKKRGITKVQERAVARRSETSPMLLSYGQQRLWFLSELQTEAAATYHITAALRLDGTLNQAALRTALVQLTGRQASLRMNFHGAAGDPVVVLREPYDPLVVEDLRALPREDREELIGRLVSEHARQSFDLENDPLLRLKLVEMGETDSVLLFSIHHIIADAWSLGVLVNELGAFYDAANLGQEVALPPLPIQYLDYAAWQRDWLRGEVLEKELTYWRGQLTGAPELLPLPTDFPRPAVKSYRGARQAVALDPELVRRLNHLSWTRGASLFMTLLAAFKVMLYRYSHEEDIVVGTPIANRTQSETEPLIGFFVNTLALRCRVVPTQSFGDLLAEVRRVALAAYSHQGLPFELLVGELQPERSLSHSPLFQVMLALENTPLDEVKLGGVLVRSLHQETGTAKFDLLLNLTEQVGALHGAWEYSTDLFRPETIRRVAGHYEVLLRAIAENPDQRLVDLPLLTPDEQRQLVVEWNDTAREYTRDAAIHQLFEARVEHAPDDIALIFQDQRVSYQELNQRANQLAHCLRRRGVGPNVLVGICAERSVEMIVGILGILKAGGAYVPLDPAYPSDRLSWMMEDAQTPLLLTQDHLLERLPVSAAARICLDRDWAQIAQESVVNPASQTDPEHLAYVIYTSGSTGLPKGVCVPHRAVVRLVRGQDFVEFSSTEVFLQLAPISFDASTFEIWGALLNGARLSIAPAQTPTLDELANILQSHQVTVLWLTAGLFHLMVEHNLKGLRGVRFLVAGGDILSPRHVRKVVEELPGCQLVNGYGPTENTTFTCCYRVKNGAASGSTVPIGRPIANTQVYVLDKRLRPVPIGVVGQLYTGGDGLAAGYLNRPELTAERFIRNPFLQDEEARLYCTGDLVRHLSDGNIEFVGRIDHQLKLSGFRIEPGEIESLLRHQPGVKDAVVVAHGESSHRQLVAYLLAESGVPDLQATRESIRRRLPDYMVPAHFVVLSEFPLTANGKLDRTRLPPPAVEDAPTENNRRPLTATAEVLAGLWREVLKKETVGSEDNFFHLGGNSLVAMQLIARIRTRFHRQLPLAMVFTSPTLCGMAAEIDAEQRGEVFDTVIPRIDRNKPLPLSFAQERLWFLHQLEPENPFYNIPLALRLDGALDSAALRRALHLLAQRHESLRTNFRSVDGRPIQVIAAIMEPPLSMLDFAALPTEEQERAVGRLADADARKPFDLSRDPLLRAQLLRLGTEQHVLLLSLHHIVSDGWSMGVLTRDLSELYDAVHTGRESTLSALPLQYVDFAAWQREWLSGDALERQLAYWKAQLAGASPGLKLPTDRPRPAIQSFRGKIETFEIEADLAEDLRKLGNASGATLFMTLLAGFSVLLARYADQWDLVIGSPIANRTRTELAPLIGFFVNTLALRIRLAPGMSLREVVAHVREDALNAYAHQDLPFERLVDELQTERDLSRNPLFQVMFALQNAPDEKQRPHGLGIRPVKVEAVSAQFDLVMDVWENEQGLTCVLEYSTDLFDRETVVRLLHHYRNLLAEMVAEPEQSVTAVRFIDASERQLLLDGFNSEHRIYPVERTLHELFEREVARGPQRTAIVDRHSRLTYGELNARANRIAHLLREKGIRRGNFVGILQERGCDFLAAILGVLKTGGAFLPLDPAYPAERLRHMIEDSKIPVLITRGVVPLLPTSRPHCVIDLNEEEELGRASIQNPEPANTSQDVAYLLYTSGSTGLPKGAMVRHDGAVSHIFAQFELLSFTRDSAFLQSAPCSSDISVWQFLAPVLIGGRVVVADFETVCDPARLIECIRREGVTLIELVPAVLSALLEYGRSLPPEERTFPALRFAMVTGEAVSVALINAWIEQYPGIPIVNAYGPTEAADDVCQCIFTAPLPPQTPAVPIGRPLPNVWLYVLDRELALVPVGVPGELCVSGVQVGAGYWNDAARTKESFPPNPYTDQGRGRTLYRTGDRARWLPDGRLEYLGRFDDQVKLRGFRIELGEIESVLTQHPAVREAVVVARTDEPGENTLAAYVTPQFNREISADSLEDDQIALWADLHDDSYHVEAGTDPTFNCIGWDSNYTGQPLPEAEMREYVETAVERVLSLRPRRLVEIGCGTGLLAFRLIPECEDYLGVDLSATAIDTLRRLQHSESLQARTPGLNRARFVCARADRIREDDYDQFDVAILPSVVQYFPSLGYLDRILRRLALRVAPEGSIFVGDVRDLRLLEALHASVQIFKASPDLTVRDLRRRIERSVAHEQELCVHPDYFRALPGRVPGIASVEILPKPGRHRNEMTRFRYDVMIRLGSSPTTAAVAPLEKWNVSRWPECVSRALPCGWSGVPNARVHESLACLEWLARAGEHETVADLRTAIEGVGADGVDPQEVWDFAAANGCEAFVRLSREGEAGSLDMALAPFGERDFTEPFTPPGNPRLLAELSNHPLLESFARDFVPKFRSYLKSRLPGHMVPADFVVLDRLPLNPAGKVDRQNLPPPRASEAFRRETGEAPETDVERRLAAIWGAVLGVERIGRRDNFFDLGGHSLKATQVVSWIEKELGTAISLREVFNNPTLAEFAPLLESGAAAGYRLIQRLPDQEHYPVSHAQQRLWVLHFMDPDGAAYNMPSAVLFEGPLDRPAFERAIDWILQRHESLRTVFLIVDGKPRQRVSRRVEARLDFQDLREEAAPLESARRLAQEDARRPFDLERGPLFRLKLLRVAEESHVFIATLHHIISDDWSGAVLIRELSEAYAAACAGCEPEQPPLSTQYRDYSAWQNTLLAESSAAHREYWHRQLEGELPTLDLPFARARPAVKTFAGERVQFAWERGLGRRLIDYGRQRGASLFMTLLASVTVLLHRYTRQRDIVLGSPVAGRSHADLEDQIGFYVNTLVLRSRINPTQTFEAFLDATISLTTAALDHQIYPFDRLVNDLNLRRDMSRSPLFDVMVVLQNAVPSAPGLRGLKLAPFPFETNTSQFDLTFSFEERKGKLCGEVTFNTDLFSRAAVERMTLHLRTLIEGFLAIPQTQLNRLPLLSAPERNAMQSAGRASVPTETVVDRFQRQVSLAPGAVAVSCGENHLSYRELNAMANQLARRLVRVGVSQGDRVGLFAPRSVDLVVAVLGILKMGAAYVPFDPEYPRERRAFMAADSGISALVTHPEMELDDLPGITRIDLTDPSLAKESGDNLAVCARPSDVAYIIYTSGSTGQPKGVLVSHSNIVRLFDQCTHWYAFGSADVWTLFHSIAFDFSVWELWGALCYGGRLVVVPYWTSRSPADFLRLLVAEKVTVLNQTPSAFRHLIQAESGARDAAHTLALRCVIFGGEALELAGLRPWFERHGDQCPRLVNMYGITETTVHVTYRPLAAADVEQSASVIGEPIADLQLYLLDEHLEPVPIGVPGEIHVGGAGLALGYVNRPALTAERFVPDHIGGEGGARLYRTGDLARRLENGDIEYLGRLDDQVKIRGFRIETGEIASHLSAHPEVRDAVVIPVRQVEGTRLAAYVVSHPERSPAPAELRAFLRIRIPEYMMPASFTIIDAVPLTPHGKLDRRALPAPVEQRREARADEETPTDAERTIAAVWAELLGLERVGVDENIFDIGANSILVIQVQQRLRERGGWIVSILDLFRYPTVKALAAFLTGMAGSHDALLSTAADRAANLRNARQRRAQIRGAAQ